MRSVRGIANAPNERRIGDHIEHQQNTVQSNAEQYGSVQCGVVVYSLSTEQSGAVQ